MKDRQDYQGTFAAGSYRLLQLLGPGPLSRTYLAEHQSHAGERFALKIMEAAPLLQEEDCQQILREILDRKHLQHEHILLTQDEWIQEQVLYLATPYVEAGSLRQRMEIASGSPLPLKEALTILRGVGEALDYAHQQQIAHANVKPENILLQANGSPLLVDFLLPALIQSPRAARTHATFLARYMAPEQFQQGNATPSSDQYALACLACELLTGHTPFDADNFDTLAHQHLAEPPLFYANHNREQVQHLETIVLKALSKHPEDRYPDIAAFIEALNTPPSLAPYVQTVILPALFTQDPQPALILAGPPELQTRGDAPTMMGTPAYLAESEPPARVWAYSASLPAMPSTRLPNPARNSQVTPKQLWLIVVIIGLTVCVTLSAFLILLNTSPSKQSAPGIAQGSSARSTSTASTGSIPAPTAQSAITPTVQNGATPAPPAATAPPALLPTASPTPGTTSIVTSCAVHYSYTSQWGNGFVASIEITNSGPISITNWTLAFNLSGGQHVTGGWNGSFTQNGSQVSVQDASFNATIPPGAAASPTPGFQATFRSNNATPTAFTLNGVTCSILAA